MIRSPDRNGTSRVVGRPRGNAKVGEDKGGRPVVRVAPASLAAVPDVAG